MFRRIATLGAAAVLVATGTTLVAALPAYAGTVAITYLCGIPPWGAYPPRTYQVTINAPATATRGQTVTLSASIGHGGTVNKHMPAGESSYTFRITLGGASSGYVEANVANPELQPGDPWHVDGTTQATLAAAGTVTFHPDQFHRGGYICIPRSEPVPAAAATTQVR